MKENNSDKKEVNIKKEIDGYITINDTIKKITNKQQLVTNIVNDLSIENTIKKIKSIIIPTEVYIENLNQSLNYLNDTMRQIADIIKPITETVINYQIKTTPYFKELGKVLKKARENPDSLINWINYCEKLEEYIWTFPFDMKSEELKNILENVNSEEEFDKYMIKYFNNSKITKLCANILGMLPYKHKVTFRQIMEAFFNKNYALCNLGITAIIDDLCTFFLNDKGCLKRNNLFLPIIEDVDNNANDNFEAIPLIIVNANINKIYENVDFTKRISITTHKKTRRCTNQHGKKFVNNKLDTIMLLNTIYYILVVIENFSEYRGRVIYVNNRQKMDMAFIINRSEIPGFYIKKKYYRIKK